MHTSSVPCRPGTRAPRCPASPLARPCRPRCPLKSSSKQKIFHSESAPALGLAAGGLAAGGLGRAAGTSWWKASYISARRPGSAAKIVRSASNPAMGWSFLRGGIENSLSGRPTIGTARAPFLPPHMISIGGTSYSKGAHLTIRRVSSETAARRSGGSCVSRCGGASGPADAPVTRPPRREVA